MTTSPEDEGNEGDFEENDYDSGPFCSHYNDPAECQALCKCSHTHRAHSFSTQSCEEEKCGCKHFENAVAVINFSLDADGMGVDLELTPKLEELNVLDAGAAENLFKVLEVRLAPFLNNAVTKTSLLQMVRIIYEEAAASESRGYPFGVRVPDDLK